MQTAIKFAALGALAANQQITTLQNAIDFEFKKPQILLDMLGKSVPMSTGHIKTIDGRSAPVTLTEERIKAFLAQKYATSSDNPILNDIAAQFATFFHSNMPEIDTGWTVLFDLVDLRSSSHDHFDLIDTNAGISYEQIKQGGEIKKRTKISEARTIVPYLTYGAGLGILDDWLRFQQFWKIDEATGEFRAKAFDKQAELHYALFTAQSAAIDVAFDTDDTTTFNKAAASIFRALRDKGYGLGQNAGLYILTSPERVGRVTRMLAADRGSGLVQFGTLQEPIAYTVLGVIASTHVPANDTGYYLVLPGRKIKRGLWKDLSIEAARNAALRAEDIYGHMQFNGIVGDTAQVRRVLWQ